MVAQGYPLYKVKWGPILEHYQIGFIAMDTLNVKIILGSTRDGRFSEHAGAWVAKEISKHTGITADVLDLREYPMPFFAEAATPSYKKEPYAHPVVAAWTAKIAEADAFIVVSPEYNHGYSAVLKNALDYVYEEWNNKPIAFVAYGSALGARAVEQLRQVAVELQMAPIRNAVHIPYETVASVSQGTGAAEALAPFVERLSGLIEQLSWWAKALRTARREA